RVLCHAGGSRARDRHRARRAHQAVPTRPRDAFGRGKRKGPRVILAPKCSDSSGPVSLRSDSSHAPPGSEEPAGSAASARVGRTLALGSVSAPASFGGFPSPKKREPVLTPPTEASGPSSEFAASVSLRSASGSVPSNLRQSALYGRVNNGSRRI